MLQVNKNRNDRIYILMATYNGEKYLEEQIDSILNQSYKDWTLIIHDDNSKDKTVSIIKEYVNKYPNKIILLDDNIATGGAKENFTYLLNKINDDFDYIMFSDQDDVWLENKIEITLKRMKDTEIKYLDKPILIHTDLTVVDKDLKTIAESMIRYQKLNISNQYNLIKIAIENVVTGCTMMINKLLFHQIKYLPLEAIMHDWYIAILTLKQDGIIEFEKNSTILYRQHAFNTIGSKEIEFSYYFKKLVKIKTTWKNYNAIYNQYRSLNINITKLEFIIMKIVMIIKKVF